MDTKTKLPNLVSILTLDRLELTKKAVDSVLEHSASNVQIVFFDNGSTDGTIEYLDELERVNASRVTFLRSDRNLGVAAGRNRVFSYAISTYGDRFGWVLSLDNDCMVHADYDQAITRCIEETGASAVCPRIIQPDGRIFHNAHTGFLIDLEGKRLKLEYGDTVSMACDDPRVSQRMETDVILGTSAKTPRFLDDVGQYDEGHFVGWEDFSIALRALDLKKEHFQKWKAEERHRGTEWVPLRKLINGELNYKALVVYEPACVITHDHPVDKYAGYERTRWDPKTIADSTDHFEEVWGVRPVK